MVKVEG